MELKVRAYADAQPYYISYFYAGLCDLAHQNKIQLHFTYPWSALNRKPPAGKPLPETLWLEVQDTRSGQVRTICFDHHDKSYLFAIDRLEQCDVYLKRSYHQPDVDELPSDLSKKVVPFGLDYPCRSPHDRAPFQRVLGYYVTHRLKIERLSKSIRNAHATLYYLTQYFRSLTVPGFEGLPDRDVEPLIFYQTKVYGPGRTTDNTNVNEWRASIIRALREAFGDRFVGGLMPTDFAKERYPDCVTSRQTDRESFIKMVKGNLINVFSRGLHYSTSWKLGEYLASANCVVAEPPRNKMPVPLEAGRHYLSFGSPEECVEACAHLLQDPELASAMRINNYEYYRSEVRPSTHILKCLTRAFDQ